MNRKFFISAITVLAVLFFGKVSFATEIFGEDTGKECAYCHIGDHDRLEFTIDGEAFVKNYYRWPLPVPFKEILKEKVSAKLHRLLLGAHSIAAYLLIGILVFRGFVSRVNLERGGIPEREQKINKASYLLIAATGLALIPYLGIDGDFWSSQFGFNFGIKITLFLALFCTSAYMGTVLERRIGLLRERIKEQEGSADYSHYEKFTKSDLKKFTGSDGKPALVAFKGKVFDVTDAPNWGGGFHLNRHRAGYDLTEAMNKAPHKTTVMQKVKVVGDYDAESEGSGSSRLLELQRLAGRYGNVSKLGMSIAAGIVIIMAIWRL